MKVKIEKPAWAIGVGFKHEGHVKGMAIGPAWFYGPGDMYAFDGPNKAKTRPLAVSADGNREWFTLRQVEKTAKNFNLIVEEF